MELKESIQKFSNDLSETDNNRLANNALRLFDSKDPICQEILDDNAPLIYDFISKDDLTQFNKIIEHLDYMNIPYSHDKKLVRGLDYYTHTTFEITSDRLGSQDALCGGGRYNKLIEELGGKPTPAVGFAAGIERLLIVLNKEIKKQPLDIYLILLGSETLSKGLLVADALRKKDFSVVVETLRRSMKAQMREANKLNAKFVLIIGENELKNNNAIIKNMSTSEQTEVSFNDIVNSSFFLK